MLLRLRWKGPETHFLIAIFSDILDYFGHGRFKCFNSLLIMFKTQVHFIKQKSTYLSNCIQVLVKFYDCFPIFSKRIPAILVLPCINSPFIKVACPKHGEYQLLAETKGNVFAEPLSSMHSSDPIQIVSTIRWCYSLDDSGQLTWKDIQLLRMKLYPATSDTPGTAFTFDCLKDFHLQEVECKIAALKYITKIHCLSSPFDSKNKSAQVRALPWWCSAFTCLGTLCQFDAMFAAVEKH